MPTLFSVVFLHSSLIVLKISCLAHIGDSWRLGTKQQRSQNEKQIRTFPDYDESKKASSNLACLVAFLLTQSGPAARIVSIGRQRLRSHVLRIAKRDLGIGMGLSLGPEGRHAELGKLLKVAPELGSVLALSRGRALEVDGTPLKNDPYDSAMATRQVQSTMSRTKGSDGVGDVGEFPKTVSELKAALERPGNNIFDHQGTKLPRASSYDEVLGKGVQGVVYKMRYRVDGQEKVYAVKALPFEPDVEEIQVRMAVKEILTMVKATDKHMVKLHDVYFKDVWNGTASSPMLHLVLDCGQSNYHSFIEDHQGPAWDRFRYEAKLSDTLQMCLAIRAMHRVGIAHRDLKPGNVVVFGKNDSSGVQLKLIDFGSADGPGVGGSFYSKELRGTPEFVSPEVAENFLRYGELPNLVDGRDMDLWALGITLYKLLTGDYPFHRGKTGGSPISEIEVLCESVMHYKDNYPASAFTFEASPMALKAKHVINGLLHPTPRLRMNIDEAIQEISKLLQEALVTT